MSCWAPDRRSPAAESRSGRTGGPSSPPATASIVDDPAPFRWSDEAWCAERAKRQAPDAPLAVYEVHAGSWLRHPDGRSHDWSELADKLVDYVSRMGFTHVEFLPVMAHPFAGSWGYQPLGQFAL